MNATFAKARLAACRRWPYAASAILSLIPVEKPGLGRVEVDRHWRIYVDPVFFEELSFEEQQTEILRNFSRLLRQHHKRFAKLINFASGTAPELVPVSERRRWWLATELEVNDDLDDDGFVFHVRPNYPPDFGLENGQTAEFYHGSLKSEDEDECEQQTGNSSHSKATSSSQSTSSQESENDESQSQSQTGSGDSTSKTNSNESENDEESSGVASSENDSQEDEQNNSTDSKKRQSAPGSNSSQKNSDSASDNQENIESANRNSQSTREQSSGSSTSSNETASTESPGSQGQGQNSTVSSGTSTGSSTNGSSGDESSTESSANSEISNSESDDFGSSASDGIQRSWEEKTASDKKSAAGDEQQDKSEAESAVDAIPDTEQEQLLNEVADKIVAAASRGSVPGHLKRWANARKNPKIDYGKLIRRKIQNAIEHVHGTGDYTFRRLPRRDVGLDRRYSLPALQAPNPRVTVIIDTSGSVSDEELELFVTELGGVLRGVQRRDGIEVICADAKVQSIKKITRVADLEIRGGGGTNMDIAIEEAASKKPRPQLVICFSDGETPWPKDPVGVKTIAVLSREHSNWYECPKWIEKIVLE